MNEDNVVSLAERRASRGRPSRRSLQSRGLTETDRTKIREALEVVSESMEHTPPVGSYLAGLIERHMEHAANVIHGLGKELSVDALIACLEPEMLLFLAGLIERHMEHKASLILGLGGDLSVDALIASLEPREQQLLVGELHGGQDHPTTAYLNGISKRNWEELSDIAIRVNRMACT